MYGTSNINTNEEWLDDLPEKSSKVEDWVIEGLNVDTLINK